MSDSVRDSIYEAIASIRLIDPHTHINPHTPASSTLADLFGYHYYTELAHSAGMPKHEIEADGVAPRELVRRLVNNLSAIENTAQYRWLVEICRMFFGFDGDRIDASNWEEVYDSAQRQMQLAQWPQMVLDQSNVEAVFLTNDFDDALSGFDTDTYIPCLRTDDLVFHLAKSSTRQRLAGCSGIELDGSLTSLRESLNQRFEHFVGRGARACAISLPPSFEPTRVSDGRATTALNEVLRGGPQADPSHQAALSRRVFWTLAELCDEYSLPFDLMIGVNRGVYAAGVFQGQDLFDSRVSLIQYRELFNSFPEVKFPVSVLASVTNQELVSYAWIFPNVITNGHWWYSNTPSFIARDAAARLEAVPQTKQIAYYSDAYKLEFVWPKFDMYRRVLAGILADHFVKECRWSEERAIQLGRQVLRDNVDEIFPRPSQPESTVLPQPAAVTGDELDATALSDETAGAQTGWGDAAVAGTSAALAAGAIGMVEVNDPHETLEQLESDGDLEPMDAPAPGVDPGVDSYSTLIFEDSASQQGDDDSQDDRPEAMDPAQDLELTTEDTVRIETVIEEPSAGDDQPIDELDALGLDEPEADQSAGEEPGPAAGLDIDPDARSPSKEDPNATIVDPQRYADEADEALDLDPLPSAEEIQAVEVDDVELVDFGAQRSASDAETIETEADSEPLDVGNLLGDDDAVATPGEEIRMLRSDESFEPDEDSLKLQPDPLTGELTFPVESSLTPSSEDELQVPQQEPSGEPASDWPDDDLMLDATEPASEDADAGIATPSINEEAVGEDALDDDAIGEDALDLETIEGESFEIDLDETSGESDERDDYLNP